MVEAEERHVSALPRLFEQLGLEAPEDHGPDRVEAPGSLADACERGVAAEIANGEMYDRLIAQVADPDVIAVMRRLQAASQEHHLPAFERCSARERARQE